MHSVTPQHSEEWTKDRAGPQSSTVEMLRQAHRVLTRRCSTAWRCAEAPSLHQARQIDAGKGLVVATDRFQRSFLLNGGSWKYLSGQRLKHITTGDAGIWGVGSNNQLYRVIGGNFTRVPGERLWLYGRIQWVATVGHVSLMSISCLSHVYLNSISCLGHFYPCHAHVLLISRSILSYVYLMSIMSWSRLSHVSVMSISCLCNFYFISRSCLCHVYVMSISCFAHISITSRSCLAHVLYQDSLWPRWTQEVMAI